MTWCALLCTKLVNHTHDVQIMMQFFGLNNMGNSIVPKAGFPVNSLARMVALLNYNGFGVVSLHEAHQLHVHCLLHPPQALSSPSACSPQCTARLGVDGRVMCPSFSALYCSITKALHCAGSNADSCMHARRWRTSRRRLKAIPPLEWWSSYPHR